MNKSQTLRFIQCTIADVNYNCTPCLLRVCVCVSRDTACARPHHERKHRRSGAERLDVAAPPELMRSFMRTELELHTLVSLVPQKCQRSSRTAHIFSQALIEFSD